MNAKEQFKKYKESLKDDIYDFSEKGWSFIGLVIQQHITRETDILDAGAEVYNWEEWD